MSGEDETLEIHKLVIGHDEVEAEATDSISEYLITRAAFHANKLGRSHYRVREFDVVKDAMSNGWILVLCAKGGFDGRFWGI